MEGTMVPDFLPTVLLYNLDPAWPEGDRASALQQAEALERAMLEVGHPVEAVALKDRGIAEAMAPFDPEHQIVFNWCECLPGVAHSEPLVARALEDLGFTFTGASSEALALAGDKGRMKEVLEEAGIPTPTWGRFEDPDPAGWSRFPAIVKPVNEHCSEGITSEAVVMDEQELEARISFILEAYRQPALVEDFIDGREFHVSLWGNGRIEMLPPAEMDFSGFSSVRDRLCTYESKHCPGSRHYEGIHTLLPAPLSAKELATMEDVCGRAYRAIGCRDYGRIDLRVRDGAFYILDVNPNADISLDASLACAAEVAGHSYGQAGSKVVRMAAHRHPVWGRKGRPS
jgi:D-alanine-D-alanine ligase